MPLTERILHHMGAQGEAAIARGLRGALTLFRKAAGAGVITVFTATAKYVILWVHDSWKLQALFVMLNYMGSFLLMRLLGFSLATKISSLMAAAWVRGRGRLVGLGLIARSQAIAAAGNFLAVIPGAFAFHLLFSALFGHPFFDPATARHVIESLDPLRSSTIAYAALTGVLLWLANWAAGALRASPASDLFLGGMLAGVPAAARLFGSAVDVRHFTLSSAAATLAVCSLGADSAWRAGLPQALAGLAWIAAMNFGVSFAVSWLVSRFTSLQTHPVTQGPVHR